MVSKDPRSGQKRFVPGGKVGCARNEKRPANVKRLPYLCRALLGELARVIGRLRTSDDRIEHMNTPRAAARVRDHVRAACRAQHAVLSAGRNQPGTRAVVLAGLSATSPSDEPLARRGRPDRTLRA